MTREAVSPAKRHDRGSGITGIAGESGMTWEAVTGSQNDPVKTLGKV